MAFERARVALAALEEKLRRQLGLAGDIGATFTPSLTPVLIAGDLRDAGNAFHKGRWFRYSVTALSGANGYHSLVPSADVLITCIELGQTVTTTIEVWLTTPSEAPAVATTGLAGTWVDRKDISADQVPLSTTPGVINNALAGTNVSNTNRILTYVNPNNADVRVFPVQIMLPAGSALNFHLAGAGIASLNVAGRIWP